MTIQEIAALLDGIEYGAELPAETVLDAKRSGAVIVFGASNDLIEFRGAIEDELLICGGGFAYLDKNGLFRNKCDNKDCPYFIEKLVYAKAIIAIWDCGGYSWMYTTEIPHETFEILEDRKQYCRGIVFSMEDL